MTCDRIHEILNEYLDGELPDGPRRSVDEHLAGCAACRAELDALKETARLVGSLPRVSAPHGLAEAIVSEVEQSVRSRQAGRLARWVGAGGWLAAAATLALVIRYVPWDGPPEHTDLPAYSVSPRAEAPESRLDDSLYENGLPLNSLDPGREADRDGALRFGGPEKLKEAEGEIPAASDESPRKRGGRDKLGVAKSMEQKHAVGDSEETAQPDSLPSLPSIAKVAAEKNQEDIPTLVYEFADRAKAHQRIVAAIRAAGGNLAEAPSDKGKTGAQDLVVASIPRHKLAALIEQLSPKPSRTLRVLEAGELSGGGGAASEPAAPPQPAEDAKLEGAAPGARETKPPQEQEDRVMIRILLRPKAKP